MTALCRDCSALYARPPPGDARSIPGSRAMAESLPDECGVGCGKQPRQTLSPGSLTLGLEDQILADFDFDIGQTTALGVYRDGVIG
jgi:hypothetical protein